MQASAIVLVRAALTDLVLWPGRVLSVRVVERNGERGTLALAGMLLDARIPLHVSAGQRLRVRVERADPNELVLRMVGEPANSQPQPPQPQGAQASEQHPDQALVLPGGWALVRHASDERSARRPVPGKQRTCAVSFSLRAPHAGDLDFHAEAVGDSLRVRVALAHGEAFDLAMTTHGDLERALRQAFPGDVAVEFVARREPVDAYG
ncbi:MAG: hypothetical protein K6T27_04830 [Thermoleophilum sp.]|nr:hypothetical protein [Thermoleophilum sp.]